MNITDISLVCFFAVSLLTAAVTIFDKAAAKKALRRVPEKLLFLLALLGGSAAEYITMRIIRHKTLHKRFMIGLPLIFFFQLVAVFGTAYLFLQQ